jgi:sec-independent protein translocase protein TatA
MFGSLGAPELLIILAIVVVLFGATRISGLGRDIGKGIREFRRELREGQEEDDKAKKTEATAAASTKPTDEKHPQAH